MDLMRSLPFDLQRQIDSELESGESVLWSGQPKPGRFMLPSVAMVIFGIPWTAFSIFWMTMAAGMGRHISSPAPLSFLFLFGLPFVLIGLGMLSSPYWLWRKALQTVYAITNRRALIFDKGWRGNISIRSLPPDNLCDRRRTQRADGSGDLIFTRLTTVQSSGEGGTTTTTVGFIGISDVKMVDTLIRQTFEERNDRQS